MQAPQAPARPPAHPPTREDGGPHAKVVEQRPAVVDAARDARQRGAPAHQAALRGGCSGRGPGRVRAGWRTLHTAGAEASGRLAPALPHLVGQCGRQGGVQVGALRGRSPVQRHLSGVLPARSAAASRAGHSTSWARAARRAGQGAHPTRAARGRASVGERCRLKLARGATPPPRHCAHLRRRCAKRRSPSRRSCAKTRRATGATASLRDARGTPGGRGAGCASGCDEGSLDMHAAQAQHTAAFPGRQARHTSPHPSPLHRGRHPEEGVDRAQAAPAQVAARQPAAAGWEGGGGRTC